MQLSIDFDYNDFFAVPDIKISLDDLCLHHGKVNEHFEFDIDLEDGPHQLTIDHHGKNQIFQRRRRFVTVGVTRAVVVIVVVVFHGIQPPIKKGLPIK